MFKEPLMYRVYCCVIKVVYVVIFIKNTLN